MISEEVLEIHRPQCYQRLNIDVSPLLQQ
ncbi:unnamed protein product, partial [Rotaria sp. Silwood1]